MAARDVVRAINVGRVALGVGLVLAPRRSARVWIGDDACRDATAVVVRAHGTREIVLGGLAIEFADDGRVGPRVVSALLACDVVDLAVTVAARRSLPRSSALVALLAAVGMAGQAWAAARPSG
jgi:hypothetical protein